MTSTTSPSTRRIYCNPLDLEYRYQDVRFTAVSYTHLTLPTKA